MIRHTASGIFFFFQAEDGIRDLTVTGVQTCALPISDGRDMRIVRRMGLVGQVFSEPDLAVLGGRAAIGHTRYSTTGSSRIQNAQPMVVRVEGLGELAISHNGNCINARDLREDLAREGVQFTTS